MRKLFTTGLALLLIVAGGCSRPLSSEQKSELSEAVVGAHLDTLQALVRSSGRSADSAEYRRVILLKGDYINERVSESIRKGLEFPFATLRTDSTDVDYTHETAQASEGKSFRYTDDIRDQKTGLPVRVVLVDSIRGIAPGKATLHLYEADNAGRHYQGLKWWMVRGDEAWQVDSMSTIWIN